MKVNTALYNPSFKPMNRRDDNQKKIFQDALNTKASSRNKEMSAERADAITISKPEKSFREESLISENTKIVETQIPSQASEASVELQEQSPASETSAVQPIRASLPKIESTDSVEVKLAKLREIAAQADYTGMSAAQVCKEIYDRYNDAFDGNLMAIGHFSELISGGLDISRQLREEINNTAHELRKDDPTFSFSNMHNEALGYGGMSSTEIHTAIIEKYAGKSSMLDFLNMVGEFAHTGIFTYATGRSAQDYITVLTLSITIAYDDTYNPELLSSGTISQEGKDLIMNGTQDYYRVGLAMKIFDQAIRTRRFDDARGDNDKEQLQNCLPSEEKDVVEIFMDTFMESRYNREFRLESYNKRD